MGAIKLQEKDFDAAHFHHNKARELCPSDSYISAKYATALIFLGEPEEALKEIRRAEKINPFCSDELFEDESRYITLNRQDDLPGIEKRENIAAIYIYTEGDSQRIVLPVRGKGLWSTLWGFVAVDSTGSMINGITFYEHGETPGLGGEVDNVNWKELWKSGKQIYDEDGSVKVKVLKKGTPQTDVNSQVDGLAGATITTNGVSKLLQFWLGDLGFKKFLTNKPWLDASNQPNPQSVAAQDIDTTNDGEK